ncbi:mechanosensitive ion channel family protein [Halomicronema sp. CCY15110]|uniref:mechanosensitive ion channel family protein n=1 Tax=Halomicronema sp. CCY15110 TaxID=2767773 RepID=UPI00194EA8A4|nr:mechanosensitive ion channel family protein [Halomicronema sp. CCY15110]
MTVFPHLWLLAQDTVPTAENLDALFKELTWRSLAHAGLTVAIAYGLLTAIQSFTTAISEKVPRRFRLIIKQSVPFLKALVLLVAIVRLLHLFVNPTGSNLLALTGTIAVALGFAFKDYISSIIAGIVTLFEGSFRMGDRVRIGDHYGEVVNYGLREVRLRTPNDDTVTIPHNTLWNEPIANANSGQLEAQVVTDFYVAHEADLELVSELLYQAAYSSRYTQLKLPVVVVIQEKAWATQLKLKAYPMDARDEFLYQTDLVLRVKQACARHHVPYPQMGGAAAAEAVGASGE